MFEGSPRFSIINHPSPASSILCFKLHLVSPDKFLATMGRLQLDPFLNELTSMFERSTEKGSVWVTLKHSSDKSKVQRNKMKTNGETVEYKCLIRATDGKKTVSAVVGAKDHQRFQASYATILKAHMTALKKRERKEKRKVADSDKKQEGAKKPSAAPKAKT